MSLRIENLTVKFHQKVTAVDHVNVEIGQGIYGLLGENGAGDRVIIRPS